MAPTPKARPPLVEAMLDPGFYPHRPEAVELRETHVSWVFRAGALAYKLKKPLVLPFLDYGTAARRAEMCEDEVRLNRRLAPRIYRRVVSLVPRGDGFALSSADDPEAVDHAVEMEAIDEERTMEALNAAGILSTSDVEAVARLLAAFHSDARVVQGHEALRAEHAIVPLGGAPYIYDCIEFDPCLREIDVAADLAFLVMDLVRLGRPDCARDLLATYRAAGGDPGDEELISFFAAYRAWVRSMVACERAAELVDDGDARAASEGEARRLFDLGHRFAWRSRGPFLIVVCGLAASGKTTLAERLAAISGHPHLSSDLVRRRCAGLAPGERGGPDLYTEDARLEIYRELGRQAAASLDHGEGAIVDATFHREVERFAFEEGMGDALCVPTVIECKAPPSLLLRRADARLEAGQDPSDAGATIVLRQLGERDPLDGRWVRRHLALRTDIPLDLQIAEVECFVDRG